MQGASQAATVVLLLSSTLFAIGGATPIGPYCGTSANKVLSLTFDFDAFGTANFTATNFGVAFPQCDREPFVVNSDASITFPKMNEPLQTKADCMAETLQSMWITNFTILPPSGSGVAYTFWAGPLSYFDLNPCGG
jgi:hypothetical protein